MAATLDGLGSGSIDSQLRWRAQFKPNVLPARWWTRDIVRVRAFYNRRQPAARWCGGAEFDRWGNRYRW